MRSAALPASTPTSLAAARRRIDALEDDLKQLAATRDAEIKHATEWERRAMAAVNTHEDDLAVEALERKREHDMLVDALSREHDAGLEILTLLREMLDSVDVERP